MTDNLGPKLAETGFFKTVHDAIERATIQFNIFAGSANNFMASDEGSYSYARSTLLTLYYVAVYPHNLNNPNDPEVKDFKEKWNSLNEKYGNEFEMAIKVDWDNGGYGSKRDVGSVKLEMVERFSLVMVYLNTLGITQLKQREEKWEDTFIEYFEEQLRK